MKLNYDIIRDILLDIESKDQGRGYNVSESITAKYTKQEIRYHVSKMEKSGLIEVLWVIPTTPEEIGLFIKSMTIHGHMLISDIDNPKRWDKIKKYLYDNALSLTVESVKLAIEMLRG